MHSETKKLSGRKRKTQDTDMDTAMPDAKRLKTSPSAGASAALKRTLELKYHTKFSWSFFKFWEWLQLVTSNQSTLSALECINLRLVGPFEFLNGDLSSLSDEELLIHYRYHFDLPEFQTILLSSDPSDVSNGVHFGLWRDDPQRIAVGIARAKEPNGTEPLATVSKKKPMFSAMESNLFLFILRALSEFDEWDDDVEALQTSLRAFMASHGIEQRKKDGFAAREKFVVSRTFHGLGLVVPVRADDVGYRPIGYSDRSLKRIFKRMHSAKAKGKKVDATEMEVILTNVCLADDEGDPGMGYELGIDFFCSWPMFHRRAQRLLSNSYALTKRKGFGEILSAHCKVRGKQNGEYDQTAKGKGKGCAKKVTAVQTKMNSKGKTKKEKGGAKITKFFAKPKAKGKAEMKKANEKSLDDLSSDDE